MNGAIQIVIADDEQLFREGLLALLAQVDGVEVAATFANGQQLLHYLGNTAAKKHPHVVLLDLKMTPLNGIEVAKQLSQDSPHLKLIVLSSYYSYNYIGYIFKLGVHAFLPKATAIQNLIQAIYTVVEAGLYLTDTDHKHIVAYMRKPQYVFSIFNAQEPLTRRETEVLRLICEQYTNHQIADALSISKRTVDGHRNKLIEKTGAKNTAGLVIYAVLNKIIQLDQLQLYKKIALPPS